MLHVFDTCNIVCFSVRQLSSSWKNLASAMPLLRPTVKHSLKAVVVLVSVWVVMKNKYFVSHCYSIMLYYCFNPGSRCWKAQGQMEGQGHFHNTIYEFGIPAIQSACMCVCVSVFMHTCRHTHVSMHAGACVLTQMRENSCIDVVLYGKHTTILTIDRTKICNISGFHTVEFEDSGHLECYTVEELTDPDILKELLRTLRSVNSTIRWNISETVPGTKKYTQHNKYMNVYLLEWYSTTC